MQYNLEVIAPPVGNFITLDEAKAQLNYSGTLQDAKIQDLATVACSMLDGHEGLLGRSILTQTLRLTTDRLADLRLGLGEVQSISSVAYKNSDGAVQTLDSSIYSLKKTAGLAEFTLAYNQVWPTHLNIENSVQIDYVAGYGDSSDVPAGIKQLALYLVGQMYYNRSEVNSVLQDGVVAGLVNQYKLGWFGNL